MAKRTNKWSVVVDGQAGKEYDKIHSMLFMPNSERVAYIAQLEETWYIVINEMEAPISGVPLCGAKLMAESSDKLYIPSVQSGEVSLVEIEIADDEGDE